MLKTFYYMYKDTLQFPDENINLFKYLLTFFIIYKLFFKLLNGYIPEVNFLSVFAISPLVYSSITPIHMGALQKSVYSRFTFGINRTL